MPNPLANPFAGNKPVDDWKYQLAQFLKALTELVQASTEKIKKGK